MATQIHEYPVSVDWTGGRNGNGGLGFEHSGVEVPLAVPPEFGGAGGASNPEELLTGAVAACYAITYGIVSTNRRLPVLNLKVEAVGTVHQDGANYVYTQVTLRPRVVLTAEATDEQLALAEDLAQKAEKYCIVTNTIRDKVHVVIEAQVERAQ